MNYETDASNTAMDLYAKEFGLTRNVFKSIYNLDRKINSIKNQYANEAIRARIVIIRFFSNTGKYEYKIKKDLCKFNRVDMENLFKQLNIAKKSTFDYRKHIIKNYMDWCVDNGYMKMSDERWFVDFSYEDLNVTDSINLRYFKSFDELSSGVKTIINYYNPVDKHRFDVFVITYYLSWFGFNVKEICKLPAKCIDYQNNCVILNGIKRDLNEETCKLIREYMDTDGYNTKNGGYEYTNRLYQPSNLLLRTLTTKISNFWNPNDLQIVSSRIANKATKNLRDGDKFKNHKFYLKDIYICGCFYRIYEYICYTGKPIDRLSVDEIRNISLKSNETNITRANFIANYKNWASTFYAI